MLHPGNVAAFEALRSVPKLRTIWISACALSSSAAGSDFCAEIAKRSWCYVVSSLMSVPDWSGRAYHIEDYSYAMPVYYDDDGNSQEYLKNRGQWTRFAWDDKARRLTIEPAAPRGATNVAGPPRTFTIQLMTDGATKQIVYRGQRQVVTF